MSEFHLPYHWLPFDDKAPRKGDLSRTDFISTPPPHLTHDRYVPDTHSGRILCSLTTTSPIVAGGLQTAGAPKTIHNFEVDGKPAIPASSLRGLISNIAEAASNSALRVLDSQRQYSFRRSMEDTNKLSALGDIHIKDGQYFLRPLVIPTLEANRDGLASLPSRFTRYFPKPVMKVYLGNRHSIFSQQTAPRSSGRGQFYAMRLAQRSWLPGFQLDDDDDQYRKPAAFRRFVLSQLAIDDNDPVPYDPKIHTPDQGWVAGYIRALGCWPQERQSSIPPTKKHELFIPVTGQTTFEIPKEVVDRFHTLADERTEASVKRWEAKPFENPLLPFEPKGTREDRYKNDSNHKLALQTGDIVYFDVDSTGRVSEISFSSIWRGQVRGKLRDFFPPALLPFDDTKQTLTPADLLFGFVEDRTQTKSSDKTVNTGLAFASRVRFAAAQFPERETPRLLKSTLLRILDSPKPPSPSFYFKSRTQPAAIRKSALDPKDHQAQGRKQYLHQPWQPGQEPWATDIRNEGLDQKAYVQPIDANQTFYFHLDFDNLTNYELGLLLYALNPDALFQHKIGLGKALGLGSVKVDIAAVFPVLRASRYQREALTAQRYESPWLPPNQNPANWPDRYSVERLAAQASTGQGQLEQLRAAALAAVPLATRRAIELLGNPAKLTKPVSAPLAINQQSAEDETFRWNVNNDRSPIPQFLRSIEANSTTIPVLRKNEPQQ